eukprot:CAMPEP_0174727706 /NCGR_PEP_ID=MMETSP1094-20130205/50330_1 /TAXON_ID=156173 /ORGANISM="Chrysochromulina brevifilum, Strain UTEX LB 985" /LENGTH=119 /DNA_ID=CAMNT_0015929509 /DNA_START=1 /DNA_END=361 /DNA_ORIENTATION=-
MERMIVVSLDQGIDLGRARGDGDELDSELNSTNDVVSLSSRRDETMELRRVALPPQQPGRLKADWKVEGNGKVDWHRHTCSNRSGLSAALGLTCGDCVQIVDGRVESIGTRVAGVLAQA